MSDCANGLLDVLKETLEQERRICQLMTQHKAFLIAGREGDAQPILDEIDTLCTSIVASEQRRQAIVQDIARKSGLDAADLTADALLDLPSLLSVREEMAIITTDLRHALRQIVQLRDEIEVLAQHAKAYSDTMLKIFQQITQSKPYGRTLARNSRFISVRT